MEKIKIIELKFKKIIGGKYEPECRGPLRKEQAKSIGAQTSLTYQI